LEARDPFRRRDSFSSSVRTRHAFFFFSCRHACLRDLTPSFFFPPGAGSTKNGWIFFLFFPLTMLGTPPAGFTEAPPVMHAVAKVIRWHPFPIRHQPQREKGYVSCPPLFSQNWLNWSLQPHQGRFPQVEGIPSGPHCCTRLFQRFVSFLFYNELLNRLTRLAFKAAPFLFTLKVCFVTLRPIHSDTLS